MAFTHVHHIDTGKTREDMIRRDDGAFIPADPLNHDWLDYQVWLKAGNTPAEPVATVAPSESASKAAAKP